VRLTPQQIEDLEDGWHIAVTLDPGDIDTLHAHLTFAHCDESGKRLWDKVMTQIKAQHFLDNVGRDLGAETR
jgi:hypothetical protein